MIFMQRWAGIHFWRRYEVRRMETNRLEGVAQEMASYPGRARCFGKRGALGFDAGASFAMSGLCSVKAAPCAPAGLGLDGDGFDTLASAVQADTAACTAC